MTISSPVICATPTTSAPVGRAREAAAGARAGLDERFEAEAQAVAVARDRQRVDRRARAFLRRRRSSPSTRGSRLSAAITRSPSRSLKSFWTGSPYPVDAGTSMMRAV